VAESFYFPFICALIVYRSSLLNPSLYLQTIRHLRPWQISSRLLRRINGRGGGSSVPASIAFRSLSAAAPWLNKASLGKGGFTFLNLRKEFPSGSIDWRSPEMPKLWRYNLHYFDYLNDPGRPLEERCRLIDDWIADNPVGAEDAWEPFPVSLRIVNWIKFFLGEGRGQATPARLKSLYQQSLWLERNIEHHLLANHLFKNAKALVFAGLFFEGSDAGRWRDTGLALLRREISEQVLPDGGHFERSPMYHSMILEDCLDLVNLCRGRKEPVAWALAEQVEPVCRRMVRFLNGATHPDGEIALFNDAAFGIEPEPAELAGYCGRLLGELPKTPAGRSWAFPDTGYFVMAPRAGDRLIVDCGPIGPDYQPGHSHCDTLSFELSLGGRRVVVDSGCCQYEANEIRKYNRGNAGHNTVTIDGENQSEVWGAHRCARRAYPLYARLNEPNDGALYFEGAHDGYKRLKGKPVHHRSIAWAGDTIDIGDRIEGQGTHNIESRLHIHPYLKVEAVDGGVRVSAHSQPLMTVSPAGQGRVEIESGWYCPEFNKKISCPVLTIKLDRASLPVRLSWVLRVHER
jgi:uncharacterized heparinase superfamily protein